MVCHNQSDYKIGVIYFFRGPNLLFRWFVGFSIEDPVWHHSTFTKNRDRLLEGDIARRFFAQVLAQADQAHLLSKEHFSVDGTVLEAWASHIRIRVTARRMVKRLPKEAGAIPAWIFGVRSASGIPMNPKQIRMRLCIG